MAGILYLVPTPIGNLGDISIRCRETLEQADFIAAEDTRVTLKLLNHLGIKKSLVSYYEHNKASKGDFIVERILNGETCALVSDAGSPAISDPGEELEAVRRSRHNRLRNPRSLCCHHCPEHLRPVYRPILLRRLSIHVQKKPSGAFGVPDRRTAHHGLLRSAP